MAERGNKKWTARKIKPTFGKKVEILPLWALGLSPKQQEWVLQGKAFWNRPYWQIPPGKRKRWVLNPHGRPGVESPVTPGIPLGMADARPVRYDPPADVWNNLTKAGRKRDSSSFRYAEEKVRRKQKSLRGLLGGLKSKEEKSIARQTIKALKRPLAGAKGSINPEMIRRGSVKRADWSREDWEKHALRKTGSAPWMVDDGSGGRFDRDAFESYVSDLEEDWRKKTYLPPPNRKVSEQTLVREIDKNLKKWRKRTGRKERALPSLGLVRDKKEKALTKKAIEINRFGKDRALASQIVYSKKNPFPTEKWVEEGVPDHVLKGETTASPRVKEMVASQLQPPHPVTLKDELILRKNLRERTGSTGFSPHNYYRLKGLAGMTTNLRSDASFATPVHILDRIVQEVEFLGKKREETARSSRKIVEPGLLRTFSPDELELMKEKWEKAGPMGPEYIRENQQLRRDLIALGFPDPKISREYQSVDHRENKRYFAKGSLREEGVEAVYPREEIQGPRNERAPHSQLGKEWDPNGLDWERSSNMGREIADDIINSYMARVGDPRRDKRVGDVEERARFHDPASPDPRYPSPEVGKYRAGVLSSNKKNPEIGDVMDEYPSMKSLGADAKARNVQALRDVLATDERYTRYITKKDGTKERVNLLDTDETTFSRWKQEAEAKIARLREGGKTRLASAAHEDLQTVSQARFSLETLDEAMGRPDRRKRTAINLALSSFEGKKRGKLEERMIAKELEDGLRAIEQTFDGDELFAKRKQAQANLMKQVAVRLSDLDREVGSNLLSVERHPELGAGIDALREQIVFFAEGKKNRNPGVLSTDKDVRWTSKKALKLLDEGRLMEAAVLSSGVGMMEAGNKQIEAQNILTDMTGNKDVPPLRVPMTYKMKPHQLREDLRGEFPQGTSTMELIQRGHRRSTTRNRFAAPGQIITFENDPTRYVVTEVKKPDLSTPEGRRAWEAAEGWSLGAIEEDPKLLRQLQQKGAVQTFFKPLEEVQTEVEVRSGGQTGADRGGLEAAKELGVKTSGYAPKGFRTEKGSDPTLKDFGLVEHESSDYPPRTRANVVESQGTVLFGNPESPGSKLTISLAKEHKRPILINPTAEQLSDWMVKNKIHKLNVAGNRESKDPGIQARTKSVVGAALKTAVPLLKGGAKAPPSTPRVTPTGVPSEWDQRRMIKESEDAWGLKEAGKERVRKEHQQQLWESDKNYTMVKQPGPERKPVKVRVPKGVAGPKVVKLMQSNLINDMGRGGQGLLFDRQTIEQNFRPRGPVKLPLKQKLARIDQKIARLQRPIGHDPGALHPAMDKILFDGLTGAVHKPGGVEKFLEIARRVARMKHWG